MERLAEISLKDSSALNDKSKSLLKQVSSSQLNSVKIALASMAYFRGGEMSAVELGLYSDALADEFPNDGEDVVAALKYLERNRGDFERNIPAMPELVALVRARRSERRRKIREAEERAQYEAKRKQCEEERRNEKGG